MGLNQLVAEEWAVGAQYRFTRSELDSVFSEIAPFLPPPPRTHEEADLHRAGAYLLFNHPSGFYARAEWLWFLQESRTSVTSLSYADECFEQVNLFAGYRFPRQRAEITLGVMNLTAQDYRLNPLSLYEELPRERVFFARFRFRF
jgi:outer membrane receptor protein involved in Fe transport